MSQRISSCLAVLVFSGICSKGVCADNLVRPFLNQYCIDCHQGDEADGDRDLVALSNTIPDDNTLADYRDILDQLNLSEMPPPEADQPSDQERQRVIEAITEQITTYHQHDDGVRPDTVLRRLNRREYRNTITDLLKIDASLFDPTRAFPLDDSSDHLDNVGETLVTSSHLLMRYLDAADASIRFALEPLQQPDVQSWAFRDNFRQQPEIDSSHRIACNFKHMRLYDCPAADKPEGALGPIHGFEQGVPVSGVYRIRVNAKSVNRDYPYDESIVGVDKSRPMRLGIVPGHQNAGELHLEQTVQPLLAEIELTDQLDWYERDVWFDAGYTPRFTFQNGMLNARGLWGKLYKKYPGQFKKKLKGIAALRKEVIANGKVPHIAIHEIEITGPHFDSWPKRSQKVLLAEHVQDAIDGSLSVADQRDLLQRFANRAFRRPASNEEVSRLVKLVARRRTEGQSQIAALADGFKATLCSPNFIYLDEPVQSKQNGKLTPDAIATRLSYFLWSTMPDEHLLELAASRGIIDRETLTRETERMLDDPRSHKFVADFLDSWLTLRDLGSAAPDRGDFPEYYQADLGPAMRAETQAFFADFIANNRPVEELLTAKHSFLNSSLAKLYGLPDSVSDGLSPTEFERVDFGNLDLKHPSRRGGLLSHASVLTVTANGVDTSPVTRGIWMLENILGTPPSPPPPDVEPLDPDTRGAKTIRDQLDKHRSTATCYACHRKIDPLGFALENYDAIGRWRDRYSAKANVDASGELPDGQSFKNAGELTGILAQRTKQLTRALTSKCVSYAIGRELTIRDRIEVDRIVKNVDAQGRGVRDLIHAIVASKLFQSP